MSAYDLVLVHAPSVYDFRKRNLLYGPVSDLIPSTPVFEMYPIGFTTIASLLASKGYKVRILNLAAHMLADGKFDAERAIKRIDSEVFGIDLHWMPHAHGSLEVAKLIKQIHPNSKVVMGGFSASYYSEEILRHHQYIDTVFRGDSAEVPMLQYLDALEKGAPLEAVQNLAFREGGKVRDNGITHVVKSLDEVEFDYGLIVKMVLRSFDLTGHLPYLDWKRNPMLLVSTVRGCAFDCGTCMGACSSFERNFGRSTPAFRSPEKVLDDIRQIESYFRGAIFLLGYIQQSGKHYAEKLLSLIKQERPKNEIVFEFFAPPSAELSRVMGDSLERFDAQISPDSHDPTVRDAQGRHYSNKDLESSISNLLGAGARRVDIFFMIGLPKQDAKSVQQTVEYSGELIAQLKAGERFMPFISPLAPFIDPGSDAFEDPDKLGYKIFARTLAEHRELLLNPSWKHVLNYETKWMTRGEIVDATYSAGVAMNDVKEKAGMITKGAAQTVRERTRLAIGAMSKIDAALASPDQTRALDALREELQPLSESTVCDKRELDWSSRSIYWDIPRAGISLLLGK